MTTWPALTGKVLLAALKRAGFRVARIKGSHHILKPPDGRMMIVPVHAGETIGTGLLSKVLQDCDLTREKLQELQ